MYLSKIKIHLQQARNPYDIHRALWRLFPDRPEDNRNFLFRVEKQKKGADVSILMQSETSPEPQPASPVIIAQREYRLKLTEGQRLRFRLRANPVKTIADGRGRLNRKGEVKKCRVPLIQESEQIAWLQRKLENACSLETVIIQKDPPLYFRKKREQRTGKIQTICYDGIFKVNRPQELLKMIRTGLGPAKAFGCGLLSLTRA